MSQIDQFLIALKRALKTKNILYKDLAKALDLSESSVKRILSSKSMSLERLEAVCKVADISFAEVVRNARLEDAIPDRYLTEHQEIELSKNVRLLHFYELLMEGLSPEKIEKDYFINNAEVKKLLLGLDKLNLIELHSKDRVKMVNSGRYQARPDGPIGAAMIERMKKSYLGYDFGDNDYFKFLSIAVSSSTLAKYRTKLDRLLADLQQDSSFEVTHDVPTKDMGILVSYRPWVHSFMGAIKKRDKKTEPYEF